MFRVFLTCVFVGLLASFLSCVTLVRPDERAVVRRCENRMAFESLLTGVCQIALPGESVF